MNYNNRAFQELSTATNWQYRPSVHRHNSSNILRPKVLVMAAKGAESIPENLRVLLEMQGTVTYKKLLTPLSNAAFIQVAKEFNFIALTRRAIQRLDREVISCLPNLQGLSVYSTGTEWIDLQCLAEHQIVLQNIPDYCTNAVAEVALGLILMATHRLHLRYQKTMGVIPEYVSVRGKELQHSTVGIVGYGRIGRLLVQKIQPLCRQVIVCDRLPIAHLPSGVIQKSSSDLIRQSDWIVCCASQDFAEKSILRPEEYQLFNREKVLVNVARKSLFDHQKLMTMVEKNELGGYIFDDLLVEGENPDKNVFGKIVPLGHTAWYTDEAMACGTRDWILHLVHLMKQNVNKNHSLCTTQKGF